MKEKDILTLINVKCNFLLKRSKIADVFSDNNGNRV